jgi:hypothetical protein
MRLNALIIFALPANRRGETKLWYVEKQTQQYFWISFGDSRRLRTHHMGNHTFFQILHSSVLLGPRVSNFLARKPPLFEINGKDPYAFFLRDEWVVEMLHATHDNPIPFPT